MHFAKRPDWGVTGEQPSRWITRERPKIDRIACPWLIRRFIDTRAEFFYVPTSQVLAQAKERGAVAYDIPGAPVSHVGELCSFDALLLGFDLTDAALHLLATIVRGADTDRLDLSPQSAGLLAFSLGLSRLHAHDDHAMLEAAMPLAFLTKTINNKLEFVMINVHSIFAVITLLIANNCCSSTMSQYVHQQVQDPHSLNY